MAQPAFVRMRAVFWDAIRLKLRSQLFYGPPARFRPAGRKPPGLPQTLVSWLLEADSLTARLRRDCPPPFRVELLRQDWDAPFTDENRVLHLPPRRRALIREVLLWCGEVPVVAARTVIPEATLRGVNRRLAELGTRPLGEVIFANPLLQRLSLEVAMSEPERWRGRAQLHLGLAPVWGRRSLYSLRESRLLVAEYFLPALGCYSKVTDKIVIPMA